MVRQTKLQPASPLPLNYHWHSLEKPLPLQNVRNLKCEPPKEDEWRHFNFSNRIQALCADICNHSPELGHIDVSRLLFCMTQARNTNSFGLQARVTPLRFRGGELVRERQGSQFQVQRYFVDDVEILYLVTFCLPRYLDQPFEDKLITLFHELYHISPAFDGDLRRQAGRFAIHTHSKKEYDSLMAELARAYLRRSPNSSLYRFLRLNWAQLQSQYGRVVAVRVPCPRLVPFGTITG